MQTDDVANETIGIICGNGSLPLELAKNHKKAFFILLKEAEIDKSLYKDKDFCEERVGRIGKMISIFRKRKISKIYIAGGLKKPNLSPMSLLPDFCGLRLIFRILRLKNKGDNNLLTCIIRFLSEYGFVVLSQNVLKADLSIGTPTEKNTHDGKLGTEVLNSLSYFDIGQAIVVQNGVILGMECLEGTDELISRTAKLAYKISEKPVLIKCKKIGQTSQADLPTIGLKTIENCIKAGFAGIFYKDCIILNQDEVVGSASKSDFFITRL